MSEPEAPGGGMESGRGRVNLNRAMTHPASTGTIDFYAQKRALEAELGRALTYQEARALLLERGSVRDPRAETARPPTDTAPPVGGMDSSLGRELLNNGQSNYLRHSFTGATHDARGIPTYSSKPERAARPEAQAPLQLFGLDLFGQPVLPFSPRGPLALEFVWPPFSVFDARSGAWQERKRAWTSLGLEGELGRETTLIDTPRKPENQARLAAAYGHDIAEDSSGVYAKATSIFDPVLCELIYRWFSPEGGLVLDPFAGGSVRGIVASILGRRYVGVDLSGRQIAANVPQAAALCGPPLPEWIVGDSRELATLWPGVEEADLVFTCPPYGDLERYSDDPRDLSTMAYPDFVVAYMRVLEAATARLKRDRFACVVVGDIRDTKTGYYRGLVSDSITAMQMGGLEFYNDAVLVTAVGSLPVRVPAQFRIGRKLGKTHQNVLVFVKGDWRRATAACTAEAM